jgi:hypothetical protein
VSGKLSRRQALLLGGGVAAGAAAAVAGVGSASAAGPASAATSAWIRLPIVTANIGRKHLGAREAAISAVRHGDGDEHPFVGWQEIGEGAKDTGEPAMIERHFGDAYRTAFLRHKQSFRVPISVPKPWRIVDSKPVFAHGGIKKVSPPRWINEVVVAHESNPTLQFALLNTHYLFGAYNGATRPDLRDEYDHHHTVHKNRVLHHHGQGRLVIWTADTNNPGYPTATGRTAEKRVYPHGIDRIDWLPGDGAVQLQLRGTKSVDMKVDGHNARVAIFRIRLA